MTAYGSVAPIAAPPKTSKPPKSEATAVLRPLDTTLHDCSIEYAAQRPTHLGVC